MKRSRSVAIVTVDNRGSSLFQFPTVILQEQRVYGVYISRRVNRILTSSIVRGKSMKLHTPRKTSRDYPSYDLHYCCYNVTVREIVSRVPRVRIFSLRFIIYLFIYFFGRVPLKRFYPLYPITTFNS